MARFFNTAGPCDPRRHHMLPAEARLPAVTRPIERDQYFVLHAPRQTGKTTLLLALVERLRAQGDLALYVSLDPARVPRDVEAAERIVIERIAVAARTLPADARPRPGDVVSPWAIGARLGTWLSDWCEAVAPRRVILLLDEADGLHPEPTLSLLSQLRAGYPDRLRGLFPASIGLVGLRDLRDYVVATKGGAAPGPTSPFNIKVESFTLANFTADEIGTLYAQHTADTGQPFTPAGVARAWHWTRGQPLLVNALAARCVDVTVTDPAVPIDAAAIDEAAEHLVRTRVTHLDNLGERLREPRVARIMQAVLLGDESEAMSRTSDDFLYVRDLGLLAEGPSGLGAANPMYAEILTRQLTVDVQSSIARPEWPWKRTDGTLDFPALMEAWRAWWRLHADSIRRDWADGYPEAVPHLMLLAFLQRVVNGGGTVDREFASGRGRIDLVVRYAGRTHVVEVKRVPPDRVTPERVIEEGVVQLAGYLDTLGEAEGWLVVFDQRSGRTWDERMWTLEREVRGKRLHLVGG